MKHSLLYVVNESYINVLDPLVFCDDVEKIHTDDYGTNVSIRMLGSSVA